MRKYQTILNNMITLREKEELIKTESFGSLKHDAENFAMHSNFRYTAKISLYSEISLYRKNSLYSENFSMIAKFPYHSEFSLCSENSANRENFAMIVSISLLLRNFCYHCEIFAMPAKLSFFYCLLHASSSLHYVSSIMLFLHPRLVEIYENSYELGINQHNFNAKLDMMVKVYETCKTTKNNLETKSVVLIGPTHVNRLK